jgi:hypothetical protein
MDAHYKIIFYIPALCFIVFQNKQADTVRKLTKNLKLKRGNNDERENCAPRSPKYQYKN